MKIENKQNCVICFATLSYFSYQERQHHLMRQFAQNGFRVFWINSLGNLNHGPRNLLLKIISRLKTGKKMSTGSAGTEKNISIINIWLIPWHNNKMVRRINLWLLNLQLTRHRCLEMGNKKILWTYYPSDNILDLYNKYRDHEEFVLVYDCAQRLAANPEVGDQVKISEKRLLELADYVITDSITTFKDHSSTNKNVYFVPQGVDLKLFNPAIEQGGIEKELSSYSRPRIGYIGSIHSSLDLPLIKYLAENKPDWSFIFVGLVKIDIRHLLQYRNIRFLGLKEYQLLPRYLAGFDVCIIPYLVNDFTNGVFPTKMLEYLAAGKPVVSTNLADVAPFAGQVNIVKTREEFLRAIEKALLNKKIIIDIDKHSWTNRFANIASILKI